MIFQFKVVLADFPILKKHIFLPSKRIIWTVIGKNHEYWIDPTIPYCSCRSFYFTEMVNRRICYHLKIFPIYIDKEIYQVIAFDDDEIIGFTKALFLDTRKAIDL